MYKARLLLFFALVTIISSSCRLNILRGKGNKTIDTRTVTAFSYIEISLPVDVAITVNKDAQPGLTIAGYENVLKHIETKVSHDTLEVELERGWLMIDGEDTKVQINMPEIKGLFLSGASKTGIEGNITGGSFTLDISGAAKVAIANLNTSDFSSEISGAAEINIDSGKVQRAEYGVSGAAKIHAYGLHCAEATVDISGAGSAQITTEQKLTTDISGAGSIHYKGHPQITQSVSGAGSVKDEN